MRRSPRFFLSRPMFPSYQNRRTKPRWRVTKERSFLARPPLQLSSTIAHYQLSNSQQLTTQTARRRPRPETRTNRCRLRFARSRKQRATRGLTAIFQAPSLAAHQAETEGREAQERVLRLLAFACAMHLNPTSRSEPFKPISVGLDGKQAIIPSDFTEEHMAFFGQIIDDVDNALLKARLADLLWMRRSTRHSKFALAAIDSYR